MNQTYDFVIIGAGPAGLAAALEAAKQKLSVLVLDEQPEAGGQIYRSISTTKLLRPETYSLLGPDYQVGHTLEHSFRQSGVHYIPGASVWQVEPDRSVLYLRNGDVRQVGARRLLIATGAMERPVPIPGWTLPGVMGAAAADVLLKSSGTVPSGRVVLAGSGPLLWLTASRLAAADVDISAVLETTTFLNYIQALPHLPRALLAGEYLLKGLRLKRQVRSAGIPVHSGIHDLHAGGSHRLETVCYTHHEQSQKIESETLLLHEGVVSHTQLTRQSGCEHIWNELQRYWHPLLDEWGNTSVEGVAVAGDGGIVAGAMIAEASGHLAALEAAFQLGTIRQKQRDSMAKVFHKEIRHHQAIRPFLEHLYPPSSECLVPSNEATLVCRCEEVSAGQIQESLTWGALDMSQIKAFTRCGMGPCQGRMCGLTVAEIIAHAQGKSPCEVGFFRGRPPNKPITLGQLAGQIDNRD
ncbi:uncharacterized protein METZ01_LOCUS83282 [marine metagenome]|uniref:BFD-like [2Fe-2S]-binding domain-containing protein n=1 Tax=marine metagenome TaxID=408172 RepID=A0A381US24_9ZZZZ